MNKQALHQKSLKEQNRPQLWFIIGANFAVFHAVLQSGAITAEGLTGVFTGIEDLLPVGLAAVLTTIATGIFTADMKARVVFLRCRYALPGHRAFSVYAGRDPRVDVDRLRAVLGQVWPTGPQEENRTWYRMLKEVELDAAVAQTHKDFLLSRDFAGLALLFLVGFGIASFLMVSEVSVSFIYTGLLLLQFLVVRHAAAIYGARLVTTVLAHKTAQN